MFLYVHRMETIFVSQISENNQNILSLGKNLARLISVACFSSIDCTSAVSMAICLGSCTSVAQIPVYTYGWWWHCKLYAVDGVLPSHWSYVISLRCVKCRGVSYQLHVLKLLVNLALVVWAVFFFLFSFPGPHSWVSALVPKWSVPYPAWLFPSVRNIMYVG